jgi:hypothetical protein
MKYNVETLDVAMQYANICRDAADIAQRMADSLKDHRGADPESVTWSHVSEAEHILHQLREIETFCK